MKLEGSCHCGAVRFSLESAQPYPFNLCYCSICRKTAGGGGFAINLGGEYDSLAVEGREHAAIYQARLVDEASGQRSVRFVEQNGRSGENPDDRLHRRRFGWRAHGRFSAES